MLIMIRPIAVLLFLLALPSLGRAQLRISTDKDTVDFTKVKLPYSRDGLIRVTNISLATVYINDMRIVDQNANFGEFQIIDPLPPIYHIDSGDGRTIMLLFQPSSMGLRTAVLDIMTDDGDKEIELIGEGSTIQPDIMMVPQFIEFGMLAPGEFKDTTVLVIGGGKDSATIAWFDVANDNGSVYFDVTTVDPSVTFPIVVHNSDTLKLKARFTAMNSSGVRTGRAIMQGEVSGVTICEFRGEIGIPDMTFTPQVLDLGIVPQGASVDTIIFIASTGESSVSLQRVDSPNLPYSISGVPSLPYSIIAGDSLKIPIHFNAIAPGDYEEPIDAFSKNGSATGLNRSALLKAFVIPRVLGKISPQPFVVSCAIDSVYQRILTVVDTGNFPITISGVATSDTNFKVTYPGIFPDTIIKGGKRDIVITFKPSSGSLVTDSSSIINVMTGNRVIVADTIALIAMPENALLAAKPIISPTPKQYSNSIGIVSVSDLSRYTLNSLEMEFTLDPPDVAEIDTLNVAVDRSVFPNATVKAGYDKSLQRYVAVITSTTPLPSSPVIPFLQIPLRYYVAKESSAILSVATRSPEKDGCLSFANDSVTVSSANGCGDQQIRNALNNELILSGMTITPNPANGDHISVLFINAESIALSSELADINGKVIASQFGTSFMKGQNMLIFDIRDISSGTYSLHLHARTSNGHFQDAFGSIILSR